MDIIQYLLSIIQTLYQQNRWLLAFICRYIPLRQWAYDDSHSPKYEKFKTDPLPKIVPVRHENWQHLLREYSRSHDGRELKPVKRRSDVVFPDDLRCPCCGAPVSYLYRNNGDHGQYQCKVCGEFFSPGETRFGKKYQIRCPFCGHTLVPVKNRKFFTIWKCVNRKCSYYQEHLKKADPDSPNGKSDYKLHYLYREFNVDFFRMPLDQLPADASSLRFRKYDAHIMGLCLTLHVNLQLSLRKTSQALQDLYGFTVSRQQIANYCRTAAVCVKPFVDHYDYSPGSTFVADETYIRVRGVKSYIWFIMDSVSRSIIGYTASMDRSVGPCIQAMRQAFRKLGNHLPEGFRFIADGYSAYPLAAQQFFREFGDRMKFEITQVIGLTNSDAVTTEFRPYKQLIERLNRTYKASYRPTNGFNSIAGAGYDLALWVAYYNFLRPHTHAHGDVLNHVEALDSISLMPGKWQVLIYLGQKTILDLQNHQCSVCS